MRAALLGLSHPHTSLLLATLENLPEVTRIHLWDEDPAVAGSSPLASRPKVASISTNLDEVLAQPGLRFAIVCVRHDQAAAVSHRVIAAGKHLLAEKPVGLDSHEILALQQVAAERSLVATVLYARRAHPCMVAAREILHSGSLGPLFSLEARFLTTQVKYRNPTHWLFRRDRAGGGILLWLGCHCLDLLHHVSGDEIAEVSAFIATRSPEPIDVEDIAALALRFRSGAVGTFHAGYTLAFSGAGYENAAGNDSYLAFNGSRGRVVWPNLEPSLHIEAPSENGQSPIRQVSFTLAPSTSYGGRLGETFVRQFIGAIDGHTAPPATLADALRTARVIEAAIHSARTGLAVAVEPPAEPPGSTATPLADHPAYAAATSRWARHDHRRSAGS